jgi:hypothetical protein
MMLAMQPRANITAQNLPKPPRGAKASTIKLPGPMASASFHDCFVVAPAASPTPISSEKRRPRKIPSPVSDPTTARDVFSG